MNGSVGKHQNRVSFSVNQDVDKLVERVDMVFLGYKEDIVAEKQTKEVVDEVAAIKIEDFLDNDLFISTV